MNISCSYGQCVTWPIHPSAEDAMTCQKACVTCLAEGAEKFLLKTQLLFERSKERCRGET